MYLLILERIVLPTEVEEKGKSAERRFVTPNVNSSNDKPVKSGIGDQINEHKRKTRRKCSESMVPVYPG